MKKTVSLVIGIIVFVLAIVGFSSYFKDHPIKFSGFKIGGGSGSGGNGTIKGDYLLCSGSEDGATEAVYMEFKDGIIANVAIGKISYPYTDQLKQRYTKEEVEREMLNEFCSGSGGLYNCNISWNGNNIEAIGNINVPDDYRGLSKSEAKLKMENSNSQIRCTDETKAPKVSSSNTISSTSLQEKSKSVNKKAEIENEKSTSDKESSTTNSHEKDCLQLATGNYDDKRSESINYSFYCDKNIVQRKIRVEIVGQSNKDKSANYTEESYKKYLKEKFCDKYNLTNCEYIWMDDTKEVDFLAECKTNYAGLSVDTVEGLFEKGQSVEESLEAVCEK